MSRKLLMVLVLIMTLVVPGQVFAAPPSGKGPDGGGSTTETVNYVAIGDSIAYGTGATNDYGYVYLYRDFLATNGTEETSDDRNVELTNKAIRGIKTNDLLAQVKLDQGLRRALKKANVITVSIGGNNLLSCASDNYSTIDHSCADAGVKAFERDWVQIIDSITSLNPTATVQVLNLYNPYKDDSTDSIEKKLYDQADKYINGTDTYSGINDNLNLVNAPPHSYIIVDVYSAFSGTFTDGTFKVSTYTHFSEATRDPHPTDEGHSLIAQLHH